MAEIMHPERRGKEVNLKAADEAMQWARTVVSRNGGEVPDWSAYNKFVKEKTGTVYSGAKPIPSEYHYAYLRVKGLSHSDALKRLDLSDKPAAGAAKVRSAPWWQFW